MLYSLWSHKALEADGLLERNDPSDLLLLML